MPNIMWRSRIVTNRGRELAKILNQQRYKARSNGRPTYWPSDRRKIPAL